MAASRAQVALPLAVLDSFRRATLRPLAPRLGWWFRDRALRASLLGAFAVALALALTAAVPLQVLALGPILFGIPHLAADARYLVVRQGLYRRALVVGLVLVPALAGSWTTNFSWVFAPVVGAALCARAPWCRRVLVASLAAALCALALRHGRAAGAVIAHAHNLVALGVWWWWARRPLNARGLVPVLALVGVGAIILGFFDGCARSMLHRPTAAYGFDPRALAEALSPVSWARDPVVALRWVLAFAFGQSVHYAVWLRLMPEEDRARAAPRTFAGSWRALRRDLGAPAVAAAAACALALVVWASRDPGAARDAYLRLAGGHAGLELGVLALLWCERSLQRERA